MGVSKYKESTQGAIYHLYNRGNQKSDVFFDASDYGFYLFLLHKYSIKHSFQILCYCLMPNHVHLLVKQGSEISPAAFISSLHTTYAMYINKKYKKVGHLFQGRYKQKIVQTDEYLAKLVVYLFLNPVEANIVKLSESYAWSSIGEYRRATGVGICDRSVIDGLGLGKAVIRLLDSRQEELGISPREAFDSD